MHIPARVALSLSVLALFVGGSVTADAHDDAAPSRVVGHVYVNDNTPGTNTIGAFDQHANGTLTPMSGSPFPPAAPAPARSSVPRVRSN